MPKSPAGVDRLTMLSEYSFYGNFPESALSPAIVTTPTSECKFSYKSVSSSRSSSSSSRSSGGSNPPDVLKDFANIPIEQLNHFIVPKVLKPTMSVRGLTRLRRTVVSFNMKHLDDHGSAQSKVPQYVSPQSNACSTAPMGAACSKAPSDMPPGDSGPYSSGSFYGQPAVTAEQHGAPPYYGDGGIVDVGQGSGEVGTTFHRAGHGEYSSYYFTRNSFYATASQPAPFPEAQSAFRWQQSSMLPRGNTRRVASTVNPSHNRYPLQRMRSNLAPQRPRSGSSVSFQPLDAWSSTTSSIPTSQLLQAYEDVDMLSKTYPYSSWLQPPPPPPLHTEAFAPEPLEPQPHVVDEADGAEYHTSYAAEMKHGTRRTNSFYNRDPFWSHSPVVTPLPEVTGDDEVTAADVEAPPSSNGNSGSEDGGLFEARHEGGEDERNQCKGVVATFQRILARAGKKKGGRWMS